MQSLIKHGVLTLIVLIISVIMYIESLNYNKTAAILPRVLLIIIIVLAIIMVLEEYIKYKKDKVNDKKESSNTKKYKDTFIFVLLIIAYILTIELIGYLIVTPLFIIISLLYFRAINLIWAFILTISFTTFIYVLFIKFLNVPISSGAFI